MIPADGKKIMILCGEPSGDRYAGLLAGAILKIDPDAYLTGVGGDHLEKAGVRLIENIRSLSVSGFTDVLRRLPAIIKIRNKIIRAIIADPPDMIVMIDFPDFHFSVAKKIKRHFTGKKTPVLVYYIPPQIWIWRMRRIRLIKRFFDAVIPVFPFELELYRKQSIPVFYSGHPIIDCLRYQCQEKTERDEDSSLRIAILPGSRAHEISGLLPVMLDGVRRYAETYQPSGSNIVVRIPVINHIGEDFYRLVIARQNKKIEKASFLVEFHTDVYHSIAVSDIVLSKPGTNNLEIAYSGKPFVVIYRTNFINWLIIRMFVKTRFASLVNILSRKEIIRELLQKNARPEMIAEEINRIITVSDYRNQMQEQLKIFTESAGLNAKINIADENAKFLLSLTDVAV